MVAMNHFMAREAAIKHPHRQFWNNLYIQFPLKPLINRPLTQLWGPQTTQILSFCPVVYFPSTFARTRTERGPWFFVHIPSFRPSRDLSALRFFRVLITTTQRPTLADPSNCHFYLNSGAGANATRLRDSEKKKRSRHFLVLEPIKQLSDQDFVSVPGSSVFVKTAIKRKTKESY